MARIFPNNDLLSLWLRLGLLAVERFASKTDDVLRVHRSELKTLTGGKRQDKAEVTLKLLASYLEVTLELHDDYFHIGWRNFSKKQGFAERMDKESIGNASELSDEFVAKLREIRPGGVTYSDDQIRAWFASKRPVMIAKGLRNLQQAATNWFPRASRSEVDAASEWVSIKKLDSVRETKDERALDSFDDFAAMFAAGEAEENGRDRKTGDDASGS